MTHIAILSGYDYFEYAQQAIQYNIISYMLKPLTIKGLGEELQVIRRKIDAQFATFRQAPGQSDGQEHPAALLAALVLDSRADLDKLPQAEEYARQCGLPGEGAEKLCYTVMVSALLNGDSCIDTPASFADSVDRLAGKYLRAVSFFAPGKVVSVLWGRPRDFEEHLYILADEIPQMAERVLGRRCRVGGRRCGNG